MGQSGSKQDAYNPYQAGPPQGYGQQGYNQDAKYNQDANYNRYAAERYAREQYEKEQKKKKRRKNGILATMAVSG